MCATLEGRGIRCWIAPRDIPYGADWTEAIMDGISGCRVMVLVYSTNANNSPHVRREVQHAFEHEATVIPLRIEACEPAKSLQFYMTGVHWLDAMTPPLKQHVEKLADHILVALGRTNQRPTNTPVQPQQQSTDHNKISVTKKSVPVSSAAIVTRVFSGVIIGEFVSMIAYILFHPFAIVETLLFGTSIGFVIGLVLVWQKYNAK